MKCNEAGKLLRLRREIAASSSLGAETSTELVKAIDEIRWQHEQETGCQCWYESISESANSVQ